MKTCEVIEQSREINYKSWNSQLLPPELREHCRVWGVVVGLWEPEMKRTSVSGVFWTLRAFVLMNSQQLWDLCKPWRMSSQSAL